MGLRKLLLPIKQSEKVKRDSSLRPALIGIIVFMIALAVSISFIVYFNWQYEMSWPRIYVVIDRQANSPAEMLALETTELINYSLILNRPPFWTYEDSWEPDLVWETWINYVNNQTVGHLLDRIDYQPQIHHHITISLNYTARSFWMSNLTIETYTDRLVITNETNTTVFWGRPYSHNHESCSAIFVNGSFQVYPGRGFQHSIGGSYGDSYFVYLSADYTEGWSPVAAFSTCIDQFIILNTTLDVQMILTIDQGRIIS